jgi:hypothetical protein
MGKSMQFLLNWVIDSIRCHQFIRAFDLIDSNQLPRRTALRVAKRRSKGQDGPLCQVGPKVTANRALGEGLPPRRRPVPTPNCRRSWYTAPPSELHLPSATLENRSAFDLPQWHAIPFSSRYDPGPVFRQRRRWPGFYQPKAEAW